MIFDRTSETGRIVHALTDERDRLRLDVEAEHARAERAEAEVVRLRAALEALHNHVMSAAPLTWAAACDTASAHLWEIHLDDIEEAVEAALVSTSAPPTPEKP